MKTKLFLSASVLAAGLVFTSCHKCEECHYEGPTGEVELGEKCGDDLDELKNNGIEAGGVSYEVHCGEDHDH